MAGLGNAITEQFMLGSATVMLGPQASLFDLNPDVHSIGMVKDFSVEATPAYTDLKQGTRNVSIYSVMTGFDAKASMSVFEYTARNLVYGLGLDGSGFDAPGGSGQTSTLATAVTGGAAAPTITVAAGDGSKFSAGDVIMILDAAVEDRATVRKVASVSTDTITLDVPLGVGVEFAVGSAVKHVAEILVGDPDNGAPAFLGAKVVGQIANGDRVVLLFPKVLITKGFTLAFGNKDYGNLPFEFTLYDLLPADPNYSTFGQRMGKLYKVS